MKYSSLFFILLMLISCSDKKTEHSDEKSGEHQDSKHSSKAAVHWNAPDSETARINPVKRDQKSVARGLVLYKTNCLACHGAQAMGDGPAGKALNPKPANLAQMSGKHPDGDFAWKITTGRGAMPPWKSVMSENAIWDVVNYIQSLSTNTNDTHSDESDSHKDEH